MNNNQYAIALFEIAKEDKALDTYKDEFDSFMELLKDNKEFETVFVSPKIKCEDKKTIISNSFKSYEENFVFFIYVILDNHREMMLEEIYESFKALYNEEKKIKIVDVLSVEALTEKEQDSLMVGLCKLYPNYQIIINNKIDTTMIGGYHVICDGKSIDLSIKNKMETLKNSI